MSRRNLAALAALVALAGLAACNADMDYDYVDAGYDAQPIPAFGGAAIGARCGVEQTCRNGLDCVGGHCAAAGRSVEGDACLTTGECAEGLACGWSGLCVPAGTQRPGQPCATVSDCEVGLTCLLVGGLQGICVSTARDAQDIGAECTTIVDCLAGLTCSSVSGTCQPGSPLLNPDTFGGVACPSVAAQPFGARQVDPAGDTEAPFVATPFPSDLWRMDDGPDLARFPTPGPGLIGFDALSTTLRLLESQKRGASLTPAVHFSFTREVDAASLTGRVRFVDLDSGEDVPFTSRVIEARGKYDCGHRLVVRPRPGLVLRPGTPYAVFLVEGVKAADGTPAVALDALPGLLDGTGDPRGVFAPLRAHLSSAGVSTGTVVGATVFTTDRPAALRDAVQAAAQGAPARVDGDALKCAAGVRSNCAFDDDATRQCPETTPAGATEYHVRLDMPRLQAGARPYTPTGGGLVFAGERLEPAGRETVCAAVLVPRGRAPAGGWPVLVYAHGTGGHFRSFVDTLGDLADRFVVMSYDAPMHGPRQGGARAIDAGALFFNLRNPEAALGNAAQGLADLFALDTLLGSGALRLNAATTLTIDPSRRLLWGHSQGGNAAAVVLGGPSGFRGGVLTGTGGSIVDGLLGKTSPADVSVALKLLLQSLELDPDDLPLGPLGWYFEPVDPITHAGRTAGNAHVLHVYGRHDSYAPESTQRLYAAATGGTLAVPAPLPAWFDLLSELAMDTAPLPISGNVAAGQGTLATVEILDDAANTDDGKPYDGHFVAFRDTAARAQVRAWLDALRTEDVPTLR